MIDFDYWVYGVILEGDIGVSAVGILLIGVCHYGRIEYSQILLFYRVNNSFIVNTDFETIVWSTHEKWAKSMFGKYSW